MHNDKISDKMMVAALKKVNFYDFIKSQNGLDTKILEQASNLSGGQQQRLALARAILKDSNCYIFDEVTSNIDAESENMIMKVIYDLAKSKTVIIISHRLKNVERCDRIFALDKGEIKDTGLHKDLVKKDGLYHKLYASQRELESYTESGEKTNA